MLYNWHMERKIINNLISWKNSKGKQPLLLRGARQIGKTYIIRDFGERYYSDFIEINFEKDKRIKNIFDEDLNPTRIVGEIEIYLRKKIKNIDETLFFFDEIQECKNAITSLKYFSEDMENINLIAAGSLLGVSLIREEVSFPVGKVDSLFMHPMNFEEYLVATKNENLLNMIIEKFKSLSPMDQTIHEIAIKEYRKFLAIGGMPNVMKTFIDTGSYLRADKRIQGIFVDYLDDMGKYTTANESIKIKECFNSISKQLAKDNKNFKYSEVKKGKDKKYFGTSIAWLTNAMTVLKAKSIEVPNIPLAYHMDENNFRLYMSDHGMLRSMANVPIENIINTNYIDDLIGILVENYVACEFASKNKPLYFWKGKNQYEIEFLLEENNSVIPVEVKNSKRVTSKSLNAFMEKYNCPYAYRLSMKNFGYENKIKSVPLYAAFLL